MNGIKKMLTSELSIALVLAVLAYTGVTRPAPPAQVVQPIIVIGKAESPRVQTTIYSAEWCQPCKVYVKHVKAEMPKDGWIVKDDTDKESATAHVIVTKSETGWQKLGIETLPTTIIRKDGKEVERFSGRKSTEDLEATINKHAKE